MIKAARHQALCSRGIKKAPCKTEQKWGALWFPVPWQHTERPKLGCFLPCAPRTRGAGTARSPKLPGAGGTNRHGHTELHPIKCFSLGKQAAKGEKKKRGECFFLSCIAAASSPAWSPAIRVPAARAAPPRAAPGDTAWEESGERHTGCAPFPQQSQHGGCGRKGRRCLEMLEAPQTAPLTSSIHARSGCGVPASHPVAQPLHDVSECGTHPSQGRGGPI